MLALRWRWFVRIAILGVLMSAHVSTTAASTLARDKMALVEFKEIVLDPYGMLAKWDGDPCNQEWNYVSCSNATNRKTIQHLFLSNLQLSGQIPSSLQNLKDLRTLDLGNNNFQGSIPRWLSNLTYLSTLDFQSNQLSGNVPKELGQIRNLNFLRLTNNSLTGHLPEELGDLSNLKIFACEDNLLSGSIPSTFSKLKNIGHFHMDHNKFTGPIPGGLGQLPELVHLIANDNQLSGPLPEDLGSSSTLQQLKLNNNLITGPIPGTFGFLTNLTDMRMNNNSLNGSIPTTFSNLHSLHVMDLSYNNLEGAIPDGLGDLGDLICLNLQQNQMMGSIPSSFADYPNLEILNLGYNNLTGFLPDLGLSGNLLSLEVENNHLSGPVPISLRRKSLDFLAYGNPLCSEVTNNGTPACVRPGGYTDGSIPSTCDCPVGMLLRPFLAEGWSSTACDCVAPLVFEMFFPRVIFQRFTKAKRERLSQNMARELYLDNQQVTIKSAAQNGTGTDVTFFIVPLAGMSLDNATLERIKKKIYAPYYAALWLDGEFGWFNYVVLLFVPPLPPDAYDLAPTRAIGPSPMLGERHKTMDTGAISVVAGCIVGGVAILVLVVGILLLLWRKHFGSQDFQQFYRSSSNLTPVSYEKGQTSLSRSSTLQRPEQYEPLVKVFTIDELTLAASSFSSENLIGTGGFGAVYKGKLQDGTAVAIKKLSGLSKQGEAEFQTEVQMIAHQLRNPHLIQLRGYCSHGDERMLVYDLMPRGSLLDYLKGGSNEYPVAILDWSTRIQLVLEAAAGLRYLHESDPPVVHRDIKPSNILIDKDFHARVADFGLSKLYPSSESSHVTTRVVGTFGYLAPDYSITGKLTVKSDVYSFGVVLLEVLSGRNSTIASDEKMEQFLIPWAKPLLKDKKKRILVIDSVLEDAYSLKGLEMMASLILSCLELDPDRRPNMGTVHNILALILDIPIHTPKAKLQRAALLRNDHSFRVTDSLPSSALDQAGSNNQSWAEGTRTGDNMGEHKMSECSSVASLGNSKCESSSRRALAFSSEGLLEESPARVSAPDSIVKDKLDPR